MQRLPAQFGKPVGLAGQDEDDPIRAMNNINRVILWTLCCLPLVHRATTKISSKGESSKNTAPAEGSAQRNASPSTAKSK